MSTTGVAATRADGSTSSVPAAVDDATTTAIDTPVLIDVLANDLNAGDASVSIAIEPMHGSAVPNGDNTITYTPAVAFSGSDVFQYTLYDTVGNQSWGNVTLMIGSIPPPPPPAPTCRGASTTPGVRIIKIGNQTIYRGTSGPDVFVGTAGRDVIVGGAGNDIICGLGGNDTIYGGKGDDYIELGTGRGYAEGDGGANTIICLGPTAKIVTTPADTVIGCQPLG